MRINLVGELDEHSRLEALSTPNQIYAWFLHKAFLEEGIDARLIRGLKLPAKMPPETDHTIIITSADSYLVRDRRYLKRLKSSTTGKLACYMNIGKMRGSRYFDYVFTQIGSSPYPPKKHVYVGWGVDPSYSYPEQNEKAAFLDSRELRPRMIKRVGEAYQTYDRVLSKLGVKTYNPVPVYNKSKRLPYPDYQAILRKCHFFLCTQFGEGGLTRLEAAACGALLVVPRRLYRRNTMSLLNHQVWDTEEDLINILRGDVDIEANRKRALEHRWKDVVKRILGLLEG